MSYDHTSQPTSHTARFSVAHSATQNGERGAALTVAVIVLAILAVISASVLAVVSTEANIAGSDLMRTRTFYASSAGLEKMTNDFSSLFTLTARPTNSDLASIAAAPPSGLTDEGFTFVQTLEEDTVRLNQLRASQSITAPSIPTANITEGPFAGLYGSVTPYKMTSAATHTRTGTQVELQREINNYLIPLFQFGMFTDGDMEIHPGPQFTFNGRVHANGNLYVNGSNSGANTVFLSKVTTANEFVYDTMRNGSARASNVQFNVGGTIVRLNKGSVVGGPNYSGTANTAGYFPDAPTGTYNDGGGGRFDWNLKSVAAADGTDNQFGGQLLTRGTGGVPLKLPFQFEREDGTAMPTREIIKRLLPMDETQPTREVLKESRYHYKSQIRILIDDEGTGSFGSGSANEAGIPAGKGVLLSQFVPSQLDGGKALRRVNDSGSYFDTKDFYQRRTTGATINWTNCPSCGNATSPDTSDITTAINNNTHPDVQIARTVRGVKVATTHPGTGSTHYTIPGGSGVTGRIYIGIKDANGVERDVTQAILSMGVTEGEPNGIVYLQRPMWAAFMQGSRDRDGRFNSLVEHLDLDTTNTIPGSRWLVDGEINPNSGTFTNNLNTTHGYYSPADNAHSTNYLDDDDKSSPDLTAPFNSAPNLLKQPVRDYSPPATNSATWWNSIVPLNVYNPREGRVSSALAGDVVYERGMTSVIEINMKNFVRWVDGVYDSNLLSGTQAVSSNIKGSEGYILYISDRRGDRVRSEAIEGGSSINTANGVADNENIYDADFTDSTNILDTITGGYDAGEDVIDAAVDGSTAGNKKGFLQFFTAELPNPVNFLSPSNPADFNARIDRAREAARWANTSNIFRRGVRLFNGEDLKLSGSSGKLSETKGITVATENMIYVWGNYNTTGITGQPSSGSTLNCMQASTTPCTEWYTGDQIPTSIIADAFFPLSKTWFDSTSALFPGDTSKRLADNATSDVTQTTSVRTALIAGITKSAMAGTPDQGAPNNESRLSGGMHNYPRFLERWSQRFNFVGCLIPLFYSTQALSPYATGVYEAPIRNWAFDDTFKSPTRLPPGTPQFQYIEPTGFRQVF